VPAESRCEQSHRYFVSSERLRPRELKKGPAGLTLVR
jgi:hypothetical protein